MVCFDDVIASNEVVFFTPTIWEWDPERAPGRAGSNGVVSAPVGPILDAASLGIQAAATLFDGPNQPRPDNPQNPQNAQSAQTSWKEFDKLSL